MTAEAIKDEALRLAPEERAKLIDALYNSFSDSDFKAHESAWIAESESRIAAVEADLLPVRESEEVFENLRKNLQK